MLRGIIATLFAGALITALTSTVCAKPKGQPQAEGGFTTRSGASLRGLQNRSASEGLTNSSSETAPISVPVPILLHENSESVTQPQSLTLFGQEIKLGNRGTSRNSGNQAPSHMEMRNVEFSAGASSLDPGQVLRVQYQLMSNPEEK